MIQFTLNNMMFLALLPPILRLLYLFWKWNFARNKHEDVDLMERWVKLQLYRKYK